MFGCLRFCWSRSNVSFWTCSRFQSAAGPRSHAREVSSLLHCPFCFTVLSASLSSLLHCPLCFSDLSAVTVSSLSVFMCLPHTPGVLISIVLTFHSSVFIAYRCVNPGFQSLHQHNNQEIELTQHLQRNDLKCRRLRILSPLDFLHFLLISLARMC